MEDILNQILGELQKVNSRLDGLEKGQRNLEQRMEKLAMEQKEAIDNLATEMRSHFRHLESKLDQHQKVFGEEHRIQRCVRQGIVSKEH